MIVYEIFGLAWVFWAGLSLVALILIASEYYEDGTWAAGAVSVFTACYYFSNKPVWEGFTWTGLLRDLLIYLIIGIIYAIIRALFEGHKNREEYQKLDEIPTKDNTFDNQVWFLKRELNRLKDNVVRWILMWPISLPMFLLCEFFTQILSVGYDYVKGVFETAYKTGLR